MGAAVPRKLNTGNYGARLVSNLQKCKVVDENPNLNHLTLVLRRRMRKSIRR
jgi:hypothetical protein